ncbi:hypothetical protein [Paraburkholderia sp. 32]|uniref:hypothetical protein n=1 Tax=Paraburkholderia sp. 32 TaxID=2991057 RepID=UPI003D1F8548
MRGTGFERSTRRKKRFAAVLSRRFCTSNAHFSLKHIGDYIGHRSISSTQIYGKLAIDQLRDVAQGDGEDVL